MSFLQSGAPVRGLHDVHTLIPPDMPGACLQELPRGRYLSTLTVLDLEGNSFLAIPEVLRHARQLTHLDLSCNHGLQVGLPDVHTLLQLHALRILDLSKVSERLPHEGPPLPNEVTLAAVSCCDALQLQQHLARLVGDTERPTYYLVARQDAHPCKDSITCRQPCVCRYCPTGRRAPC